MMIANMPFDIIISVGPWEETDVHLDFIVPVICGFVTESVFEIRESFYDGGILFLNYLFLRKDYIL